MVYIIVMHETNIRSLDLNLLVALKALLEEKHVTRAANQVGLSQPAMSRALGRLRYILKDPLLVKGITGLEWTARAAELYDPLLTIFTEIHIMLTPAQLNPAEMVGDLSIATRDNEMATILPALIQTLSTAAPGISLRVTSMQGNDFSPLERNKVDFMITGSEAKSSVLSRYTLYRDDFVCLVAANNPIKHQFTLTNFVKMKHCLVMITGQGPGRVDTLLEKKGLTRNVIIRVPHFFAAAHIVAESDLVVTVPRKMASSLAQHKKLVILEPPLTIPSFPIYLYWHIRNQNNPMHQWLRKLIREYHQ